MTDLVKYEPLGLTFNQTLTWEQADQVQYVLNRYSRALPFYWGDYANYIETMWPETYAQLIPDVVTKTMANWKWVASRIPMSSRRKDLTFSHHAEVAKLDPELRDEYLETAIEQKWSVRQLREEVQGPAKKRLKQIKCPECGWEGEI